jgi:hypothetical protein
MNPHAQPKSAGSSDLVTRRKKSATRSARPVRDFNRLECETELPKRSIDALPRPNERFGPAGFL